MGEAKYRIEAIDLPPYSLYLCSANLNKAYTLKRR